MSRDVMWCHQVGGDGRSWRSGAVVEQRWLEQWFFKITDYAEVGVVCSHMTVIYCIAGIFMVE